MDMGKNSVIFIDDCGDLPSAIRFFQQLRKKTNLIISFWNPLIFKDIETDIITIENHKIKRKKNQILKFNKIISLEKIDTPEKLQAFIEKRLNYVDLIKAYQNIIDEKGFALILKQSKGNYRAILEIFELIFEQQVLRSLKEISYSLILECLSRLGYSAESDLTAALENTASEMCKIYLKHETFLKAKDLRQDKDTSTINKHLKQLTDKNLIEYNLVKGRHGSTFRPKLVLFVKLTKFAEEISLKVMEKGTLILSE